MPDYDNPFRPADCPHASNEECDCTNPEATSFSDSDEMQNLEEDLHRLGLRGGSTDEDGEDTSPTKSKEVQRWADAAMFAAAPLNKEGGPRVYLLSVTPDPLGTVAAVNQMYVGKPVRALSEVTDEDRRREFAEVCKTRLKAPFEFVKFHFLIEGVTRAFTHQMVRQRTATYAQESMRFAVVEDNFTDRVGLPPSLADTASMEELIQQDDEEFREGRGRALSRILGYISAGRYSKEQMARFKWDECLAHTQEAYTQLVQAKIPAEDARGLLPTNILTRLHYTTDLRALMDHAGSRLCTQAQFEWRLVWAQMIKAIRNYAWAPYGPGTRLGVDGKDYWQYEEISALFKPVCYQTGKCEFMSSADRTCSIRNRVQANHDLGRSSTHWAEEYDEVEGSPIVAGVSPHGVVRKDSERGKSGKPVFIGAIQPYEWLADPTAARKEGGGHLG